MDMKEKAKIRRINRKKIMLEYLGEKCIVCGVEDSLQFDHIEPSNKLYNVTEKLLINLDELKKELNKCQLLCKDCHKLKTNRDLNKSPLICGTVNMYVNGKCRCDKCKLAWTTYYCPIKKARRSKQL